MDADLLALAAEHGVATAYRDGERRPVEVEPDVVVAVLGLLDVDASGPAARRAALAAARGADRLPGTLAARTDHARPVPARGVLVTADGTRRDVDGALPAGLPAGRHRLETDDRAVTVVVAPPSLAPAPRSWGWMLQLYALHSQDSWGIGDLGDLRRFVDRTGREHGAGAVLCNPLHAITPVPPVQRSPYTPSSRRFATPLALRVTDLDAFAHADPATRAEVAALRPETEPTPAHIDHDRVWAAKRSACELLWRAQGRPEPRAASPQLREFALFCALAECFGPRWSRWPSGLRRPDGPGIAAERARLAPRVGFHGWLQEQVQAQLGAVRDTARAAGVRVIHDLAVGCDPEGADAWALQDVLALGVRVGAPPDAFSRQGQDWGLPPWRPDRLDATGYTAYAELLAALLRQADGLRIDHVAGLWRLWWVPPGADPSQGTYVHYDAEVMLAVLTCEAARAGAMVIGEDLGTVEPEVTEGLAQRGMLSSSVLWFTRDRDAPGQPLLAPDRWPERAVATISTHDLPTAPGFLRGEHVRVRAALGLLPDVAAEQARASAERAELLDLLRAQDLLGPDPTEPEIITAMHALLARSRSRLVLVSPYDVIGEVRQPNLPGTVDEYPNWRLPLPVGIEGLCAEKWVPALFSAHGRVRR